MGRTRTYSDAALEAAVRESRSWRGVLRSLGLAATSAGAMRSARRHADRLGLDYSHFTGQRRWTDAQLAEAVRTSLSWSGVQTALGLDGGSSVATLKGHARRLGLDTRHFRRRPRRDGGVGPGMCPDPSNLARAGSLMAATWFTLCGHEVSWPLEPCRYDLLVQLDDHAIRVQVKTSVRRSRRTWNCKISTSGDNRVAYDPDYVDFFFVITGDMSYYLIPIAAVGGLRTIQVSAYEEYRVGSAEQMR